MKFEWSDKYSLGIEEIDDQHKHYFSIANQIDHLLSKYRPDSKEWVVKLLGELGDYALFHFATEEGYFKEFDYNSGEGHKRLHDAYREKIKEFLAEAEQPDVDLPRLGREIVDFAVNWLQGHVLTADRQYVELFKKHGVK